MPVVREGSGEHLAGAPDGTGPFRLGEVVKGSHYVLERNPDYWKAGRPYLDRVVLRVMPNPPSRVLAFEKGELASVDPKRIARTRKALALISKIGMDRTADGSLRWTLTVYPTHAMAQDAEMSLADYTEFVFGAGMLNEEDPVAFWRAEGERQGSLIQWLNGRDRVELKGENIDLTLSVRGRTFERSDGKYNFPDGEIFTSPVEDSANGWVRFKYPAIYQGQEVTDIELWFEDGRVIKERAAKNQEFLTSLLDLDPGARALGEWGIGTNYGIQRFSKHMLFDEKIGGTIHFAVGAGFPECGGRNESGLHWDMLCDMADSEIVVGGDLFYRNGRPIITQRQAL